MKNKTNLIVFFLVLVFSIVLLTQNAFATHPVTVFGPKTFTRTTGAQNTFQEKFSLPTILGKFTLTVNSNKVSSASIKLNGIEIFSQNAFNENVTVLTKEVSPKLGQNTFDIQIAGKPNSSLKITLTFLSPVKVLVSPEKADVTVKEAQQFKATVTGTEDQRVTWQIVEKESGKAVTRLGAAGLGSISEAGLYTAPELAPMPPFVTIQATSVANPFETAKATIIVRDLESYGQSNAEGDFDAINHGDFLQMGWSDLPEGTTKIVIYRSPSANGPWTEVIINEHPLILKPSKSIVYTDRGVLTPPDTTNDYFYKMDAFSPTGQLLKSYSPVFVPKYAEKNPEPQSFLPRFPILLASLSTLIPSTVSSACGSPNDPKFNDPFITEAEFLNNSSMSLDEIRGFLRDKNSWLKGDAEGKILDVDGQMIDFAKVVYDAAFNPTNAAKGQEKSINPQLLLTMVQKEERFLLINTRPTGKSESRLSHIVNCGSPSTIEKQIQCAAKTLRNKFDILKSGKDTPQDPPWNLSKTTLTLDGVYVHPANAATGVLFSYDPEAGVQWGGDNPLIGGNALFCILWHSKKFGFASACPSEPASLTLTGNDVAKVNEVYTATGGTEPYTYSISGGSINPATGQITSLPSCASGQPAKVTITATDSCSNQITKDVRMPNGVWVEIQNYICHTQIGYSCGGYDEWKQISPTIKYKYRFWGTDLTCTLDTDIPKFCCSIPNELAPVLVLGCNIVVDGCGIYYPGGETFCNSLNKFMPKRAYIGEGSWSKYEYKCP